MAEFIRVYPDNVTDWIVQFSRFLRKKGYLIGPEKMETALLALQHINMFQLAEMQDTLRCVFSSSPQEYEAFSVHFQKWFEHTQEIATQGQSQTKVVKSPSDHCKEESFAPGKGVVEQASMHAQLGRKEEKEFKWQGVKTSEVSVQQTTVAQISDEQLTEMEKMVKLLLKSLRQKQSRRYVPKKRGTLFDYRRTLRQSGSSKDYRLYWKGKKRQEARIIFLCDGSRSMAPYTDKILPFAYALRKNSKQVEVFFFSTELTRVSKQLDNEAVRRHYLLQLSGSSWGGGTKIGESLQAFLRGYGRQYIKQKPFLFIASDGLDTGKPELLKGIIQELRSKSAGIVWLNPLINLPGYEPTAAGMQAVLPYVDMFTMIDSHHSVKQMVTKLKMKLL